MTCLEDSFRSAAEFPLISVFANRESSPHWPAGLQYASNATAGLLLHGTPVPPLHLQVKNWQSQTEVRSKQEESHAQQEHSHVLDTDVHVLQRGFSIDWLSHLASDATYRSTSGRPFRAASLYSLSFDTSTLPPFMCGLPKFGHVSTDAVYRAASDCTCSYCNHMFK